MTPKLARVIKGGLSENKKGALKIIAGTGAGQILALMAAPILARLYSPTDFGIFTVVSSLFLIISTISALRYELAIPLPREDMDAHSLAALGLWCILLTTGLGLLSVWVFGYRLANAFGEVKLMPWLWFVPAISATIAVFAVLNQIAIRQQRYGAIGRRNLLQQLSTVVTQLLGGITSSGPGGLILGIGLGQGAGAVSLVWGSGLRSALAREGHRAKNLRRTAIRYRRFPLILAPSGLLNVLGLQLPVILIAFWYGSEVAGWLGLTQRVLALPMTLLGISIAQVYLGTLSRAGGTAERSHSLFIAVSQRLGLVSMVSALPALLFGPFIFSIVFGPDWIESGQYARALALTLAAQLVASPLSQTLIFFERQGTQLAWDGCRLVATCAAVAICGASGLTALAAIWVLSLTSTASYVASWFLSWRTVARHIRREELPPSIR